jgi:hypothetical protein
MSRIALLVLIATVSIPYGARAQDHTYDVSGYGDEGNVTGTIDSWNGQQEVEGTIVNEDGEEKAFEGEWDGYGQIEGYDEDGNYIQLETE